MFFIKDVPNSYGNHGNPVSNQSSGMVLLPDELLSIYVESKGFVNITVNNGVVDSCVINQEAYDAYIKDHTDVPHPTEMDKLQSQVLYTAVLTDTLLEV